MKSTNFFEISNSNRELSMNICRKFYNAVEFYANKSESVEIKSKLLNQAASVLTKFLSVVVNLKFLWQIHYAKDQINLETPPNTTEWENSVSFTDYNIQSYGESEGTYIYSILKEEWKKAYITV